MSSSASNFIEAARGYPGLFFLPLVVAIAIAVSAHWFFSNFSVSGSEGFLLGFSLGVVVGVALMGIGAWYIIGREVDKLQQEAWFNGD